MIRPTRVEPVKLIAARVRVRDQLLDDAGRVRRRVGEEVDHARRARRRRRSRAATCGVRARAQLRGLEHDRVAERERRRDGARREDHGRVPRRDADDDAGGRADRHRELAGDVGGDHLAERPVGLRRRLAQHPGGEHAVEHAPAEDAAGLLDHRLGDLLLALDHQVGGAREHRAPAAGAVRRPRGERGVGGVDRGARVLAARGGRRPTGSPVNGNLCSYSRP